jgi:ATP-dependent DNA helicase RecQ
VREGRPFPPDARVRHRLWGSGVVMSSETDRLTVFFDEEGYKTLSLEAAQADGLLTLETSMSSACLEDLPS